MKIIQFWNKDIKIISNLFDKSDVPWEVVVNE